MKYFWISALLLCLSCDNGAQRRPAAPPAKKAEAAPRITQFYAGQGEVTSGGKVTICYGVENARAVSIDPPVGNLSPAVNRCIEASPRQTTTYTLTAEGEDGKRVTASFTVKVRPPGPYIVFVELNQNEIDSGGSVTMCYGVRDAARARLEPGGMALPAAERHCLRLTPARTTNYTLSASGPGGTDQEKFTITVR